MNNINLIKNMKHYITTNKPTKDKYGTKSKVIYLDNHVLYALLREKKDFTKCSHDKVRAILIAMDIVQRISRIKTVNQEENKYNYDYNYFTRVMGKKVSLEDLQQLKESIIKQVELNK